MTVRPRYWRTAVLIVALLASLVLGTSFPLPSFADNGRVLQVCPRGCAFSSIATALGNAGPGDTIQVGPGIYLEHIMMRPGVAIRGEGGNVSIITGADNDTVVRAYGPAIGRDAVLEGVTVIAGKSLNGGGIDVRGGASPTIRNCLITANNTDKNVGTGESYGGGIFISGGSPLIQNNVFTKNYSWHGGGAISVWDGSTAIIAGNFFQDNKAYQYGGGININRSSPLITGNTMISNTAYYGGGVDMSDSSPEFSDNVLIRNTASMMGGGVYLRNASSPSIVANTFLTNTSYYYGGGLYMDRSTPSVSGNSFQYNDADTGGAIYVDRSTPVIARNQVIYNTVSFHGGGIHVHNSSPTVDNNMIFSNTATIGGGGLSVDGHSWPIVQHNILANNAVGLFGGAVFSEAAAPTLINNLIRNNSSGGQAGGMYIQGGSPSIRNNTIVYNDRPGSGEGIFLSTGSLGTIVNNIIIGNGYGIQATNPGTGLIVQHNDVWNNRAGNFVGVPQADNLSSDPLFVAGREGSFYLSQVSAGQARNSPALDAGTEPSRNAGLERRTTSVRDQLDAGTVDLGYHYRALLYRAHLPIIGDER